MSLEDEEFRTEDLKPYLECGHGNDFKYDLYLVYNGSDIQLGMTKIPCEDPYYVVTIVCLTIIFVVSFFLNLLVVVTVSSSYTLKNFLHVHLIVNLAITCMLDALFNIGISIFYVTQKSWGFGENFCGLNSFTIYFITTQMSFVVLFLAVDRLASVKKVIQYQELKVFKFIFWVAFSWLLSIFLALPFVTGPLNSIPFRQRYSCSISDPFENTYLISHIILVVIFPTILMIITVIFTIWTFHKERKPLKRKLKGTRTVSYFDQLLATPVLRNEIQPAMFTVFVVIIYILFWMPFTLLTIFQPLTTDIWANATAKVINQYQQSIILEREDIVVDQPGVSSGRNDLLRIEQKTTNDTSRRGRHYLRSLDFDETFENKTEFQPRFYIRVVRSDENLDNVTDSVNLTSPISHSNYEITKGPGYETAFLWMRYLFDMLIPISALVILKELRAKTKSLILCYRQSSSVLLTPYSGPPKYLKRISTSMSVESNSKSLFKQKESVDQSTPVLFATSKGLHIRTVEDDFNKMKTEKNLFDFLKQTDDPEPTFTYDICDIYTGDGSKDLDAPNRRILTITGNEYDNEDYYSTDEESLADSRNEEPPPNIPQEINYDYTENEINVSRKSAIEFNSTTSSKSSILIDTELVFKSLSNASILTDNEVDFKTSNTSTLTDTESFFKISSNNSTLTDKEFGFETSSHSSTLNDKEIDSITTSNASTLIDKEFGAIASSKASTLIITDPREENIYTEIVDLSASRESHPLISPIELKSTIEMADPKNWIPVKKNSTNGKAVHFATDLKEVIPEAPNFLETKNAWIDNSKSDKFKLNAAGKFTLIPSMLTRKTFNHGPNRYKLPSLRVQRFKQK